MSTSQKELKWQGGQQAGTPTAITIRASGLSQTSKYIPQSLRPYLNGILQDRFLFWTDYPMLGQREWMADFDANFRPRLKPGIAEKLLKRNAERLLRA